MGLLNNDLGQRDGSLLALQPTAAHASIAFDQHRQRRDGVGKGGRQFGDTLFMLDGSSARADFPGSDARTLISLDPARASHARRDPAVHVS